MQTSLGVDVDVVTAVREIVGSWPDLSRARFHFPFITGELDRPGFLTSLDFSALLLRICLLSALFAGSHAGDSEHRPRDFRQRVGSRGRMVRRFYQQRGILITQM